MDQPAPIMGIELWNPRDKYNIGIRLTDLVPVNKTDDGKLFPNGEINLYIYNLVTRSKPYATIKDVIESLISFIGNKEVYFTYHEASNKGNKISYFNCEFIKVYRSS